MDRRERIQGDSALARQTAMLAMLDGFQSELWTAMPGIVTSIDTTHNPPTVTVQPAIMAFIKQPDGTVRTVTMPPCPDVPIQFAGGGGFSATFPVGPGDEGLLIFANRCIDAWWQNGGSGPNAQGAQPQMDHRMHDLSDAIFIPGVRSQARPLAGGISLTTAQLRTDDGTTYVEVTSDGHVNLKAPKGIGANLGQPNFSAFMSANQAMPNGGFVKVVVDTEVFDSDGDFAAGRFTPKIAGTYMFGGQVEFSPQNVAANQTIASIFKNGAEALRGNFLVAATNGINASGASATGLLQMNGTTDFVELFALATFPNALLLIAGAALTYFWGYRIGP